MVLFKCSYKKIAGKASENNNGILAFEAFNFNFNFILPKVNTDYIRHAHVLNIDNLRMIILLMKFLMKA